MNANTENDYFFETKIVGESFDHVAENYDVHAFVQKMVMGRLLDRLELIRLDCKTILDLGSGTGMAGKGLKKVFNQARIIETDLSLNMLRHSNNNGWIAARRFSKVCADAHTLPYKKNTIDLVFSNLMLQWCNQSQLVFREITRVLRPGGLFVFSSFGPDTLQELRKCWKQADDHIHVMAFYDMHDIGEAISHAGLKEAVLDTEKIIINYSDCMTLMKDLKMIGASNRVQSRRKTLTGKQRLSKMINEYEKLRDNNKLPATYEIVYGHGWNLANEAQQISNSNEYVIPLESLSQTLKKK